MNAWGPLICRSKIEEIVNDILPRALEWESQKAGIFSHLIPESVTRATIKALVNRAITNAEVTSPRLEWTYGVMTVLERRDDLLPKTLRSLAEAGFDKPRLFVDGEGDFSQFNLEVSQRTPRVLTYGNWLLGMQELLFRNPQADRFAMFQDDFVTVKNLREYLTRSEYPPLGYWNLYTFPSNEVKSDGRRWFEASTFATQEGMYGQRKQTGYGAVGLVFSREALITLLSQQHTYTKILQEQGSHRRIDGRIAESMNAAGFREYVHSPSLIQHIGDQSSMGNRKHPKALSFPGETFDALSLLSPDRATQEKQTPATPKIVLPERKFLGDVMKSLPKDSETDVQFLRLSDLMRETRELASKIEDVDAVVGLARSGMIVASALSMLLHRPLYAMRQSSGDIVPTGHGFRLATTDRPQHVLFVDDTVMTGRSFRHTLDLVTREFDQVTTAAIYVNPDSEIKPDVWMKDLPWPHLLEWNLFNSVLIQSMATDFDGVLCEDCLPEDDDDGERYVRWMREVRPKYLVRRSSIPLIVTARMEKYRDLTEDWLRRWGVSFDRLVMWTGSDLQERRRSDIAEFKAREFSLFRENHKGLQPAIFVESEDFQARRIANLSRGLTVCPTSGRTYRGGK